MAEDQFHRLLQCIITAHEEVVMDCETCGAQFDCLAEQVALGGDIHELLPAVESHLRCCPDCREEFEALVSIVRAEIDGAITQDHT